MSQPFSALFSTLIIQALLAGTLPGAVAAAKSDQEVQPAAAQTGAGNSETLHGPISNGSGQQPSNAGQPPNSVFKSNGAISPLRGYMNSNPVNDQGILSQSDGHKSGVITRALGGAASGIGHATAALLGTTLLNQGIDLPPDDASSPEWPFREPNRKALYYVNWADGSSSKVSRLPDGSIQILGSGHRIVMQPEGDGRYAMFGDYGTMATVAPLPGGGYTITRADGTVSHVMPRDGGGFNIVNSDGVLTATMIPGVGGKKHMIQGHGFSHGFIQ